jgi:penicillin-insensitive murein DD-endopeptidase
MRRLFLVVLGVAGCIGPGLLTDGTSVSVGNHATGMLRSGRRLPFHGDGYLMPRRWQDRQRNYGTDELVELLARSARRVQRMYPNSVLGVADLSPRGGGGTPEHRSHRSGRDVDLLYYVTDTDGKPIGPTEMILLDAQGQSVTPKGLSLPTHPEQKKAPPPASAPVPLRKLDIPRTWAMVRTLLTDPQVSVQWIFIGRPIADLLLQHARRRKEPEHLIEKAMMVMHQPSDAQTHMDHWHLRIFCAPSDRYLGCIDRGPARWLKKDLKYLDTPQPVASLEALRLDRSRLVLPHLPLVGL